MFVLFVEDESLGVEVLHFFSFFKRSEDEGVLLLDDCLGVADGVLTGDVEEGGVADDS